MTPEEKQSLQVALSLRLGIKKATCSCCNDNEVKITTKDGYHMLCGRTKQKVCSDEICPDYRPPRLRGRSVELTLLDEISPVPGTGKSGWRTLTS